MSKRLGRLCSCGFVWLVATGVAAMAQQYSISTVAGGAPPATPVTATAIPIGSPQRVAVDSAGNFYFSSGNSVFKVSTSGTMALVAGNSRAGFSGDSGPAVKAQLNQPQGLAVDKSGNVYIADSLNNRVRLVTTDGLIKTFAGNGLVGQPRFIGDGGPATQANLYLPSGLALDSSGNLYIADTGDNSIREVTGGGAQISTIAGNGFAGYFGDANLAILSAVNHPEDVAVDSSGNVYITDTGNGLLRKITTDGMINFIAGSVVSGAPTVGFSGDNGPANTAGLVEPFSVAVDSAGNIYISEPYDGRVRRVDTKGNINTIIGNGTLGFGGDGGAPTSAVLNRPTGVAVDSSGNVYVTDSLNNRVRKSGTQGTGNLTTVAGNGGYAYSGDGGAAVAAQLNSPQAVAVDASGNFYIADTANNVVRKVAADGTISTVAGNGGAGFGGDGGAGASAQLNAPQGVAVDSSGNVYIADTANSRVRKVSGGTISTFAGSGTVGYGGDGGGAGSAQLNSPVGLASDASGNLYIADSGNSAVRKVSTSGTITTLAGNGRQGYSGDGGAALTARLNYPQGVAVDSAGNVFIADTFNNRVRVVAPSGGIKTVAGNGLANYAGDGGPATSAQVPSPTGVAVDSTGNLYISDNSAFVRKVSFSGIITTIAGNGTVGYSGDNGAALSAQLNKPGGLAVDTKGNLYISDAGNNAVRLLQSSGPAITISAVANGASNLTGAISPGEVVVIYGSGLGPAKLVTSQLTNGVIPNTLAGVSVFFNNSNFLLGSVAAPILYASANQVAVVAPFSPTAGNVQVFVLNQSQTSTPVTVPVAATAPALFTLDSSGKGQAAAINQDGSINAAAHPANAGSFISLYATGFGQTNPPGQDGVLNANPLPLPVAAVSATIGGKPATITPGGFAGGAPGSVAGVMQVNVQIPTGLAAGSVPVVIQVGSTQTQTGVTIVVSGN